MELDFALEMRFFSLSRIQSELVIWDPCKRETDLRFVVFKTIPSNKKMSAFDHAKGFPRLPRAHLAKSVRPLFFCQCSGVNWSPLRPFVNVPEWSGVCWVLSGALQQSLDEETWKPRSQARHSECSFSPAFTAALCTNTQTTPGCDYTLSVCNGCFSCSHETLHVH